MDAPSGKVGLLALSVLHAKANTTESVPMSLDLRIAGPTELKGAASGAETINTSRSAPIGSLPFAVKSRTTST